VSELIVAKLDNIKVPSLAAFVCFGMKRHHPDTSYSLGAGSIPAVALTLDYRRAK
jgi:hypothetical protein